MLHDASGPTWRQTAFLPLSGAEIENAEVAVAVLGRFTSRGNFVYDQMPTRVSLHHVHAGEGTVEMGGRSWQAGPGSVFCFVPGHHVSYRDHRGRPWRYTWTHLVGTRAISLASALGGCDGPWCRDDLALQQIVGVLDEIEAAFRSEDHSPFYPQAAAWRILDGLCPRPADGDRTAHLAAAVRRLLDAQFTLPVKLGTLAAQLGVDRSTLFRRFQTLYGCSPKTYLDRLRLDHAVALLRDGALAVGTVASRCGYSSAQRFGKAFRGKFGAAPSRWRQGGDRR